MVITQNGEPIVHNLGTGQLRIDVPLPPSRTPRRARGRAGRRRRRPKPADAPPSRSRRLEKLRLESQSRPRPRNAATSRATEDMTSRRRPWTPPDDPDRVLRLRHDSFEDARP